MAETSSSPLPFGFQSIAVMLPAQSAGELLHVASFLVVPFRYRIKRDFISLPHVVHVVGKVHVFPLKQVLLFDLRRLCASGTVNPCSETR